MPALDFPEGCRFAFTILDDTDVATVGNARPFYDLLHGLRMSATKTVWPLGYREGWSAFEDSQTLEDPEYLEFVRELQGRGFEITWHGPTMESSTRERTVQALERFRELMGHYPRIHVNHAGNRENLYWGRARVDNPILGRLYELLSGSDRRFHGHDPDSEYWWGDYAERHVEYCRNLTFSDVNVARVNPSMPYADPARPLVRWWFSACDAEDVHAFNDLLAPENQERLERERGVCIVATHVGKGFSAGGEVHPVTRERLAMLAARPGWFPNVGTLLDWLRSQRSNGTELPAGEWRRMQWTWARDLLTRRLSRRR